MRCARSVLLIMMLLAGSLSPPGASAQESRPLAALEQGRGFALEQNHPNPVNPETWIPFSLDEELFADQDSVVVTVRIFNILRQVVAIPDAVNHSAGRGARVFNLPYREPGRKLAYWDGKDLAGGRVPSGVYYCQLIVNNAESPVKKIIVLNPRRRRNIFPWFGRHRDRSP